ncbi:MAG: GHKL domain-containing protein [Acidobacteriaceae bacterium]|nr:GHKL domain-containing protein [Acidobacteriaceae bacterium]
MTVQTIAAPGPVRSSALPQAQDFAWALFVIALLLATPETNYQAEILLILIGAFQIIEPKLKLFASRRGQVASITLKMILSYLLVGWTHGIDSYYYSIFLIPVVSAATTLELAGVLTVTFLSIAAYFSFLPLAFAYYRDFVATSDLVSLMSLRSSFYAIVGFLVYQQARAKREEMVRTREAALRLAESNRELREAQTSLRRSERLAALGQLTAGLAHELRNPLGTIKASAEMLEKQSIKGRPEVMAEMAGYILSETDRMNSLVASFLDFARPLQTHPVSADLGTVVQDVVRQHADAAAARQVTIAVHAPEPPIVFDFDPDLMRIALGNLAQNAIQASSPRQNVELRVERRNQQVMIFVTDQGEGIQKEHLENIFNPFFTTKPGGVGLGLAIVAKIIDEHHGRIEVFSEPGKGTRFEIILPVAQA